MEKATFAVNQFVPFFGKIVEVTEFAGRRFLTFVDMHGLTEIVPESEAIESVTRPDPSVY